MVEALRRLRIVVAFAVLMLWGAPLAAAVLQLLAVALNGEGWRALADLPTMARQLSLSLWIGTGSTLVTVALASILAASAPVRTLLQRWLGAFLAMPHIAFAIGFGFLIMPAGLITRLLGFETPPQWVTTQDPLGLSLLAALVLKEVPFLLFLMLAVLARPDFAQSLRQQSRVAASLGHGGRSTALRIVLPQLMRQLIWPIAIIWVYGSTVIDMAIAIGPAQPTPFQISVWRDLGDADAAINARGLAGALLLIAVLAATAVAAVLAFRSLRPLLRAFLVRGPQRGGMPVWPGSVIAISLAAVHAVSLVVLIIIALSARWPFPLLLPEQFDGKALQSLFANPSALINSLTLALVSATAALGLAIGWFEAASPRWDSWMMTAAIAALVMPPVAIASGQYAAFLRVGLGANFAGVFLAQFTPVFAYVFIALKGPMRDFDPRFRAVASSLHAGHLQFFLRVKAPLLAGALAAAAAIGFAVSIGQYVGVQLVGGGSVPTLTTEAVTLASGGSRPLLAAHALVLMLLPLVAFALAGLVARHRHA